MPGTIFSSRKQSTNFFPSVVDWYSVSSKRMAPEMLSPSPGVVSKSCLYACRLTSVLSKPIDASLFPQVALDSSIARIPRPGEAIDFYTIKKENEKAVKLKQSCLFITCYYWGSILQLIWAWTSRPCQGKHSISINDLNICTHTHTYLYTGIICVDSIEDKIIRHANQRWKINCENDKKTLKIASKVIYPIFLLQKDCKNQVWPINYKFPSVWHGEWISWAQKTKKKCKQTSSPSIGLNWIFFSNPKGKENRIKHAPEKINKFIKQERFRVKSTKIHIPLSVTIKPRKEKKKSDQWPPKKKVSIKTNSNYSDLFTLIRDRSKRKASKIEKRYRKCELRIWN